MSHSSGLFIPEEPKPLLLRISTLIMVMIAVGSAMDHVGSWNDSSRLATVECLVDHGTLAIDDSMYLSKTRDKVLVDGHFYSDKPPVPALWNALWYALLKMLLGLQAKAHPEFFCWTMTVVSSGLAYVLAVLGIYRMSRDVSLNGWQSCLLAGSFAFGTLALVYVRQVNSHILLLAVVAWLMVLLFSPTPFSTRRLLAAGGLAGLGYTIDLGAGPVFLLGAWVYLLGKERSWRMGVWFLLGAIPWVVLHHVLNYSIGHTIRPVAAVPEFFQWEGSFFNEQNLTGSWKHANSWDALVYGWGLLLGPKGFIVHLVILWLALALEIRLLFYRMPESARLWLAAFWWAGVWLVYTLGSNNDAGVCCSIRWFVPLLAPAYYVLAVALRHRPSWAADVFLASIGGMVVAFAGWERGPWAALDPDFLLRVQTGAVLAWLAFRIYQKRFSK